MERQEVLEVVVDAIRYQLADYTMEITEDMTMAALGLDSLSFVEATKQVNDALNISIPEEDLSDFDEKEITVRNFVDAALKQDPTERSNHAYK